MSKIVKISWLATLLWLGLAQERSNIPITAQVPAPSSQAAPGVSFTEITKPAGLASFQMVSGSAAKDYIFEATGAGCAFVDYDNDGWLDIYLVNGATMNALRGQETAPRAALFHNNKDGTCSTLSNQAA